MFPLLAFVLFLLAAFGVDFDAFNMLAMGLALLALCFIFGTWPFGAMLWSRNRA